MPVPTEIHSLIERFHRSRDAYLSGEYNETQLRREFLDPFFAALGWDVDNSEGFAEAYKDVIHEDAIKIGTATKAPDYSFRIGGVRKFFVEAKKPAVNLKEDVNPAFQLRRYAWSAKLPLSILTDFEEFAVYDCRIKPFPADKPSTGRTMYFPYSQYVSKWEEIHGIFSKEAVLKGSFDKYAETNKIKRGTAGVDDAFLGEIEKWRTMLASNIALRNPDLTQRELNFAVQRTIDRIIFLRICEDRGIEIYGALMALQNGEHVYKRLVEMFHRADEKYNSGLFHFRPEKERNEPPDEMTLGLEIDDKPLKDIVKSLYYPNSPYEFSVLPSDILGQVYEQFLGKVIRLTAGHRAVVEDKPEVKKAGGVYYTPTYIVEYIVKNTVGRLLGVDLTPALSKGEGGLSADMDVPRYMTTDAGTWKYLKPLAQENRKQPTEAEEKLWQRLRNHQLGFKFRRQHAIDQFVVDFVCIEKNLMVEVDGEIHADQREYDAERTRMLKTRGFEVIRFWNHEVLSNIEDVLARIRQALDLTPVPSPNWRGVSEGRGEVKKQLTPKRVSALRILDPACGSGSFLIGAYQYLLDWHRDWYVNDGPEKWAKGKNPALYLAATHPSLTTEEGGGGHWRLTTAERKRILLNNIYGVDIDPQAVEVTKLSLLLKVLEGENEQTISRQLRMFHERALPDLGNNIKCGNSLIGPDFYDGQQLSLMDDEERLRINAFDWKAEFPGVFTPSPHSRGEGRVDDSTRRGGVESAGGFDAVIGNPPYGSIFGKQEMPYLEFKYGVFKGVRDVYPCFIEAGVKLLKQRGRLGFIVPSAWLGGPDYRLLREFLLQQTIENVILLPFNVFQDAYVDTAVFSISVGSPPDKHSVKTFEFGKKEKVWSLELRDRVVKEVLQKQWFERDKKFVLNPEVANLLYRIRGSIPLTFADIVDVKRGVLFDKGILTTRRSSTRSFRYFEGDVYRYNINLVVDRWVEFGDEMKERPKEFRWFEGRRILMRRLVNRKQRLMASLAGETFITNKNLYSILPRAGHPRIECILGVLNSKLASHLYINQVTQATKDDFPQVTIKDLMSLPFPSLVAGSGHDRMVGLVEQMLELNKKLPEANTDHEQQVIRRQIDATDKQIDKLVYELYDLTDEERRIVEGESSVNN